MTVILLLTFHSLNKLLFKLYLCVGLTFYCDFFSFLCINCTSAFLVLISVYFTVFNLICPGFDKLILFVATVFVGVFISFGFHYATFITLTLVRPPLTPSRHHTFTTDHWSVPGGGRGRSDACPLPATTDQLTPRLTNHSPAGHACPASTNCSASYRRQWTNFRFLES